MVDAGNIKRFVGYWIGVRLLNIYKFFKRKKDLFQAAFDTYIISRYLKKSNNNKDSVIQGLKHIFKRIEDYKQILSLQEKICKTINTKAKPLQPPLEGLDPVHYTILSYYFDRIPELRHLRPPR